MKFGGQPTPWSEVEIEGSRLRSVSHILIQEIGAAGPENAEDSARRACIIIQRQADQIVSAGARIAELEAEVARLRVDAERWRFVRMINPREFEAMWMRTMCTCAQFDELIDAARAGNGGEV